jgi:hypothetical protein
MPPESVAIAHFHLLHEAQLALSQLQEAGLDAVSSGEEATTVLPGMMARIEIRVPVQQAHRATVILATLGEETTLAPDWEDQVVAEEDGWICIVCDTAVSRHAEVCPTCATPRESIQQDPPDNPASSRSPGRARPLVVSDRVKKSGAVSPGPAPVLPEDTAEDLEIPVVDHFLLDDLARRALRATLFSILFLPLIVYALALQYQLHQVSLPLSPRATRDRSLCLFIDVLLLGSILLACLVFGPLSWLELLLP